jgi:hypothetical protein
MEWGPSTGSGSGRPLSLTTGQGLNAPSLTRGQGLNAPSLTRGQGLNAPSLTRGYLPVMSATPDAYSSPSCVFISSGVVVPLISSCVAATIWS